ncbi:MAG: hypothetical protein ABJG47_03485 [Ekhidna sp.]
MKYSNSLNPNNCPHWILRKGYKYDLILSNGKLALYSRTDLKSGKIVTYQVFSVRLQKKRGIAGRLLSRYFLFPYDEVFGSRRWSFKSIDQALEKMLKS